jgi:uncharacterized protein (DUF736 family)
MATIGNFTRDGDSFVGMINTMAVKAKTVIKPVDKASDQAPDFRVYAGGVELGAAWRETGKTSEKPFLNVTLDDPSFIAPIQARLVRLDADSQILIWNR